MESASCVQPLALTLNPLDTNAIAKEEGRDLVHGGSKQLIKWADIITWL